jgi:DNA invertase Pin-like site-specific DNA recombinase
LHGQRIGYIRVSSLDQNPERQLEGVAVDRVFTDKASGKDVRRPKLDNLIAFLDDLRRLVQELTGRGVRIEFVKEHLTFTGEDSPMANLMLSVMGAFAEYAEPGIMQSCVGKVDVPQALYRQYTPHYRRSNKDLVTASGTLNQ